MSTEQLKISTEPQSPLQRIMVETAGGIKPDADYLLLPDAVKRGLVEIVEVPYELVIIARQNEGEKLVQLVPISNTIEAPTGDFLLRPTVNKCSNCGGQNTKTAVTQDEHAHTLPCEYCAHASIEAESFPIKAPAPLILKDAKAEDPAYDYANFTAEEIITATAQPGCGPLAILFPNRDALSPQATEALQRYKSDDDLSLWAFTDTSVKDLEKEYCLRVGEPIAYGDTDEEEEIEEEQDDSERLLGKEFYAKYGPRLQDGLTPEVRELDDEQVDILSVWTPHGAYMSLYVELENDEPAHLIIPESVLKFGKWKILAKEDPDDASAPYVNLLSTLLRTGAWNEHTMGEKFTNSLFSTVIFETAEDSDGNVPQWATALTNHNLTLHNERHISIDLSKVDLQGFLIQYKNGE